MHASGLFRQRIKPLQFDLPLSILTSSIPTRQNLNQVETQGAQLDQVQRTRIWLLQNRRLSTNLENSSSWDFHNLKGKP